MEMAVTPRSAGLSGRADGVEMGGDVASDASLAGQVLRLSGLLAQEEGAKEGGQYTFPVEDEDTGANGNDMFQLSRDDTLQLIGLLNSSELDFARHGLGVLLHRLERPAVEGLTRRLFATLRRRSAELGQLLEDQRARAAVELRSPAAATPVGGRPAAGGPRPVTTRNTGVRSPRGAERDDAYGQQVYASPTRPEVSAAAPTLAGSASGGSLHRAPRGRVARRPNVGTEGQRSSRSPRARDRDEMPEVFRRLTAPPGGIAYEELQRHRATLESSAGGLPMTMGGGAIAGYNPSETSSQDAFQAAAYLEKLLEAHEQETGHPAISSRRLPSEELDANPRKQLRAPEEAARQIFERLYKSGQEHRVRRRVYHELGLLVEQAKEAQTCTFEPRVPLAAYAGGLRPEANVSDRLYGDSIDRRRRREEYARCAPAPSFRPQTTAFRPTGMLAARTPRAALGNMGMSPRDTLDGSLDEEGMPVAGLDDMYSEADLGTGDLGYIHEAPHIRLFREHADRKARQEARQENEAEWRKHTYRPDISASMASGPQVIRQHSVGYITHGLPNIEDEASGPVPQQEHQEDDFEDGEADEWSPVAQHQLHAPAPVAATPSTTVASVPSSGGAPSLAAQAAAVLPSDAQASEPEELAGERADDEEVVVVDELGSAICADAAPYAASADVAPPASEPATGPGSSSIASGALGGNAANVPDSQAGDHASSAAFPLVTDSRGSSSAYSSPTHARGIGQEAYASLVSGYTAYASRANSGSGSFAAAAAVAAAAASGGLSYVRPLQVQRMSSGGSVQRLSSGGQASGQVSASVDVLDKSHDGAVIRAEFLQSMGTAAVQRQSSGGGPVTVQVAGTAVQRSYSGGPTQRQASQASLNQAPSSPLLHPPPFRSYSGRIDYAPPVQIRTMATSGPSPLSGASPRQPSGDHFSPRLLSAPAAPHTPTRPVVTQTSVPLPAASVTAASQAPVYGVSASTRSAFDTIDRNYDGQPRYSQGPTPTPFPMGSWPAASVGSPRGAIPVAMVAPPVHHGVAAPYQGGIRTAAPVPDTRRLYSTSLIRSQ